MKIILVSLFICFIFFALLQRGQVRIVPWVLTAISVFSIYFVIFPEQANLVANYLGVGRGADLLLYLWFAISSLMLFFVFIKLRANHRDITALARAVATQSAFHRHVRREEPVGLNQVGCKTWEGGPFSPVFLRE